MTKKREIKRWTKEEEQLLISLYEKGFTYKQIQENYFFDRSKFSLVTKIQKLGITRPRYKKLNILTKENLVDCWFAGFFLGDGSIDRNTMKGLLNLSIKDIHLLFFIANHFNFSSNRVKNKGNSCRLSFSKAFILNLIEVFHISARKSYGDVIFPNFLTVTQLKFFVLGVLYSDGNVYIATKEKKFVVRFLQSYDFLLKLLKWVQENANLFLHFNKSNVSKIETKQKNYDLAILEFSGIDCVKLLRWLTEENLDLIPPLTRKIEPILNVDINSVKAVKKIAVEKRFTSTTKKKWTTEEENLKTYILENPTHTDEMIANHFNCTYRAINHKKKELGLSTNNTNKQKSPSFKYKAEEISLIKEILESYNNRDYSVLLDIVNKLNALPCNQNKPPRTIKGVRLFIQKNIDNKNTNIN